jgi:hypothetical protein
LEMSKIMERTTKCKLITREMSWQEILVEAKKIENDFPAVSSLTTTERILISCALFSENRHNIIASLPPNLTDKEFKQQLYYRTYGEHLPDDFFDKIEKQSD